MGREATVIRGNGDHSHGNAAVMGSKVGGNTAGDKALNPNE